MNAVPKTDGEPWFAGAEGVDDELTSLLKTDSPAGAGVNAVLKADPPNADPEDIAKILSEQKY